MCTKASDDEGIGIERNPTAGSAEFGSSKWSPAKNRFVNLKPFMDQQNESNGNDKLSREVEVVEGCVPACCNTSHGHDSNQFAACA